MRQFGRRSTAIYVMVALVVGVIVGGYAGLLFSRGQPRETSGNTPSGQLTLVAAGTLVTLLPHVAVQLKAAYPEVQASNSTEEYMGSLDAVREITSLNRSFDVLATVDPRQIPEYMYPHYASWEICFASNPVALVYSPANKFAGQINSTNWMNVIVERGVVVGAANASTDPNGYNAIFALELAGIKLFGNEDKLLDHFYVNGSDGIERPNVSSGSLRISPETSANALLQSGAVDFYFTYVSYAIANHLDYVNLGPWVNLGELNNTYWDFYRQVHTNIIGPNGQLTTVTGAPVVYCATIPKNSPNPTLSEYFLMFLLSPEGVLDMKNIGLTPITPAFTDNLSATPPLLKPFATPMPNQMLQDL